MRGHVTRDIDELRERLEVAETMLAKHGIPLPYGPPRTATKEGAPEEMGPCSGGQPYAKTAENFARLAKGPGARDVLKSKIDFYRSRIENLEALDAGLPKELSSALSAAVFSLLVEGEWS